MSLLLFQCRKLSFFLELQLWYRMCFRLSSLNSHISVGSCDGDYQHDTRKNVLHWNHPIIDASNKSGAIEFSVPASIIGDFFPVQLTFTSKVSYADIRAVSVLGVDDELPVKFSIDTLLYADKYEIV